MTSVPSTPFHRHAERLLLGDLRQRLAHETDPLSRVKIRIEIVHLYRKICLMKNARHELMGAFHDLSIHYPANRFKALGPILIDVARLWRARKNILPEELSMRTILFEEAGLSAYYLRDFFSMAFCVVGAFLPAFLRRPGPDWATWAGASACALALLKMRGGVRALHKALDKTVSAVNTNEIRSRSAMWKALAHEYLGDPTLADQDFRISLPHSNQTDRRLITFTLCCNLNLRGHAKEIFDAPLGGAALFPAGDALEWCTLPGLAWLGREEEKGDILRRSRAIFCANNAEAWLIAQYGGNVLLSSYLSGLWDEEEINDCISRVRMMGLRPWEMHVEASHVLVGEAYIEMTRALREGAPPSTRKNYRRALGRLAQSFPHPSLKIHELLIRAIDAAACQNRTSFSHFLFRSERLAQKTDNDWARFEIFRLRALAADPEEATRFLAQAESLAQSKKWRRHPPAVELLRTIL